MSPYAKSISALVLLLVLSALGKFGINVEDANVPALEEIILSIVTAAVVFVVPNRSAPPRG